MKQFAAKLSCAVLHLELHVKSRERLNLLRTPCFQFTKGARIHSGGILLPFPFKQVLTTHFSLSLDEILNRSHKMVLLVTSESLST